MFLELIQEIYNSLQRGGNSNFIIISVIIVFQELLISFKF